MPAPSWALPSRVSRLGGQVDDKSVEGGAGGCPQGEVVFRTELGCVPSRKQHEPRQFPGLARERGGQVGSPLWQEELVLPESRGARELQVWEEKVSGLVWPAGDIEAQVGELRWERGGRSAKIYGTPAG